MESLFVVFVFIYIQYIPEAETLMNKEISALEYSQIVCFITYIIKDVFHPVQVSYRLGLCSFDKFLHPCSYHWQVVLVFLELRIFFVTPTH